MKKAEHRERDDATPKPRRKHNESRAAHISGSRSSAPSSDPPVKANFDSSHLTIGAGVAIFQLASSCVIVCRHSVKKYWFLPKGRRDAGEDTASGAEREGFEEVDNILNLETHVCVLMRRTVRLSQPSSSYSYTSPPAISAQCFFSGCFAVCM